jgi:hemerythrin-like domain-containing protein
MADLSELGQIMHEEHFRMLVVACGLENRVSGKRGLDPIDLADPEDRELLNELIAGLDEVSGHNRFEETVLFPQIGDKGLSELTQLLIEEHTLIGPSARRLRAIAADIREKGVNARIWIVFRAAANDFVLQLMQHLQKEEMAIVQKLSSLLDPAIDHALAQRYRTERVRPNGRQAIAADVA